VPTLQETGPNNFCLGMVGVPTTIGGVAVTAGMNATIQVVTNGDGGGGLYNVSLEIHRKPLPFFYEANDRLVCMKNISLTQQ